MRRTLMFATAAAVVLAGAADAQLRSLAPQDVAKAAQQHASVIKEFGGAETGARAAYVDRIGRRVAGYSGTANAGQAYHFTTLNSPVENAFSVPGGYVYITRQLMTLMGDEGELAFVLGHETGHIAANHAKSRQARAQRDSLLGVLGVVLGSVVGNNAFGNLISQSTQRFSQLATLGFSRNQEYQADQLGIRYMTQAGYDPGAAGTMLAALGRSTALEARVQGKTGRSTPEWASTHPLSENRVAQANALARQTGRVGSGLRNRDAFLAQLDGIRVDDDPAQGVIDGRNFTHPDLKLMFTVPTGFQMENSVSDVTIAGSGGQAQFSGGKFDGNLDQYVAAVINQLTQGKVQVAMSPLQRTAINGIPAAYSEGRADTANGPVDVGVMVYQWGNGSAYHFLTLTQVGQGMRPFASMLNSLRRITDQEAAAIQPKVIRVVTVRRGDTVQSLAEQMAYRDFRVERFQSLNGIGSAAPVPGQKVKLVVLGRR